MSDQPSTPTDPAMPLAERDALLLGKAIDDLFPILWKTNATPQLSSLLNIIARAKTSGREGFNMLMAFAKRLKRNRAFDDLYILTSEMNADGLANLESRRLEIQALIELGVFETALDLVRPLLNGSITDPDPEKANHIREAYGLLGRIYKQMFIEASKPDRRAEPETLRLFLQRSFNAYMEVWQQVKTVQTTYQGVNALAIAQLAQRANLSDGDDAAEAQNLAQEILDVIARSSERDVWSEATRGEALVARGKYDEAAQAYAAFAGHPDVDTFSLGAAQRQLEEVWGLGDLKEGEELKGRPVRILKAALMEKVRQIAAINAANNKPPADQQPERVHMKQSEMRLAEQDLAALPLPPAADGVTGSSPDTLQKTYGLNSPIGRTAIKKKLALSSAVCRISGQHDGKPKGIATGFAIKGELLYEPWGPDPVIITNNHVLSARGTMGARRPETCTAQFMSDDDKIQTVKFGDVLWESDIDAHDITILKPQGALPASVVPLTELMTETLGAHAQNDNGIGRCYVIGFPLGDELSFSMADNILLDHDAPANCAMELERGKHICRGARPDPVHVHYRTPTMEGNSGSPVFDADSIKLLGVHHAGARNMRKLNGREGIYAANEGIWIESIREAIKASVTAGAETAGVVSHWWGVPRSAGAPATLPPPLVVNPGELVLPQAAASLILPGFSGDPLPGVSPYAAELIYPPGKADAKDRRAAQLETVIGVDNRTRVLDTQMSPWRMICAIRARWGSRLMVGSGCFIGPDTILTAAHVVFPREFQRVPQNLEIIPGLSVEREIGEKRPYGTATARQVLVHENWAKGFSPTFDVAVIRLNQALGQRVGWFGVGARARDDLLQNWAHVTGYPGEMKEARPAGAMSDEPPIQAAQLWHHAAPIEEIESGRIFYKTDTTPGQSGAPIYVLPSARQYAAPMVVGVHAYGTRSTPGAIGLANSGMWITPDMLKKIQEWSAG